MPVTVVQPEIVNGAKAWERSDRAGGGGGGVGGGNGREIFENGIFRHIESHYWGGVGYVKRHNLLLGAWALVPLAMPVTEVQPEFVNGGQSEGAKRPSGGVSTVGRFLKIEVEIFARV